MGLTKTQSGDRWAMETEESSDPKLESSKAIRNCISWRYPTCNLEAFYKATVKSVWHRLRAKHGSTEEKSQK